MNVKLLLSGSLMLMMLPAGVIVIAGKTSKKLVESVSVMEPPENGGEAIANAGKSGRVWKSKKPRKVSAWVMSRSDGPSTTVPPCATTSVANPTTGASLTLVKLTVPASTLLR